MIRLLTLDSVNKSIQAVMSGAAATTNPDFVSTYADVTSTPALTEKATDGALNGTTPVTVVAAPAASTRRMIKEIVIHNRDSAAVTITLNYVNDADTRRIWRGTLQTGETLTLEGVFDASGSLKTTVPSIASTQVIDFAEAVDDRVDALLAVTAGLAKNYNDAGGSLTLYNTAARADGRLTLTSATPIMTPPVTAATTLYYAEYTGNLLALYDGTRTRNYTFNNVSLSLSGLTADTNYDIWAYQNSGTVTLEAQAWTNNTTRAATLVYQDGYLAKSGAVDRRLLGTIRITGSTGQCQFGNQKFYVSNLYNAVEWDILITNTTDSWTYSTTTHRPWNNNSANRVEFVRCVDKSPVLLSFVGAASVSGAVAVLSIGLDSTSTPTGIYGRHASTTIAPLVAAYSGRPGLGYHYLQLLEYASAATVTFYGDNGAGTPTVQSGATGLLVA